MKSVSITIIVRKKIVYVIKNKFLPPLPTMSTHKLDNLYNDIYMICSIEQISDTHDSNRLIQILIAFVVSIIQIKVSKTSCNEHGLLIACSKSSVQITRCLKVLTGQSCS